MSGVGKNVGESGKTIGFVKTVKEMTDIIKNASPSAKGTKVKASKGGGGKQQQQTTIVLVEDSNEGSHNIKDVTKLQDSEREVFRALKWYKDVVDKNIVDMLPGSATAVLSAVLELYHVLSHFLVTEESSVLMSTQSQVYQSLANLIRWSDTVLMEGASLGDKVQAQKITDTVQVGIKNLVGLSIEKLEDGGSKPSPRPTTVTLPSSIKPESCQARNSMPEIPLTPKQEEILQQTVFSAQERNPGQQQLEPPPKPPLPHHRPPLAPINSDQAEQPPALPPKRRSTHRRLSGQYQQQPEALVDQGISTNRSSNSSWQENSVHSNSDSRMSRQESHYDNLADSSGHGHGWHQPRELTGRTGPEEHGYSTDGIARPGRPVKRTPSMYDNISQDEAAALSNTLQTSLSADSGFNSIASKELYAPESGTDSTDHCPGKPPLPPKKNRASFIAAYVQDVIKDNYTKPLISGDLVRPMTMYEQESEHLSPAAHLHRSQSTRVPSHHHHHQLPPPLPPKMRSQKYNNGEMRKKYGTDPNLSSYKAYELKNKSDSLIVGGTSVRPLSEDQQKKQSFTGSEDSFDQSCILGSLEFNKFLIFKEEDEEIGCDIRGGPVDALIVQATLVEKHNTTFSEAFLATYRTFISSQQLLDKLLLRYKKFLLYQDIQCKRASKNALFLLLRVVDDLIGQVEADVLHTLMCLVFNLLCDGELMIAKLLRDKLLNIIAFNKKLAQSTNALPLSTLPVTGRISTLHSFHSGALAEQMTLIDAELFHKIKIPEIILWAKKQSEELSPNLTVFTEHFNKVSYWCRSMILSQPKAQDREKLHSKFIKIMKHLKKLNNFNSYLAILSAMDSAPVRRLDWQKQSKAELEEYSMLIDSSSSFREYRTKLAEADPPCIPYLGLVLQDITFIHLGNPDHLDDNNKLINFDKCWQFFEILETIRKFKQSHYDNLHKDDEVIVFFNDFNDYLDEEAMWQLSVAIKPRNG